MKRLILAAVLVPFFILGCAGTPAPRPALEGGITPLKEGYSRLVVTAGELKGNKLRTLLHVGPVIINGQSVGTTAKDEHFIVDVIPGSYEIQCTTVEIDKKVDLEKVKMDFNANEIRYFACDMARVGSGPKIGLIGALASALASDYLYKIYFSEQDSIDSKNKLVSYLKLN